MHALPASLLRATMGRDEKLHRAAQPATLAEPRHFGPEHFAVHHRHTRTSKCLAHLRRRGHLAPDVGVALVDGARSGVANTAADLNSCTLPPLGRPQARRGTGTCLPARCLPARGGWLLFLAILALLPVSAGAVTGLLDDSADNAPLQRNALSGSAVDGDGGVSTNRTPSCNATRAHLAAEGKDVTRVPEDQRCEAVPTLRRGGVLLAGSPSKQPAPRPPLRVWLREDTVCRLVSGKSPSMRTPLREWAAGTLMTLWPSVAELLFSSMATIVTLGGLAMLLLVLGVLFCVGVLTCIDPRKQPCRPAHSPASKAFPVFVLAERTRIVEVHPSLLVGDLKRQLCSASGVPLTMAWLLCGSKPMDDTKSLAEYDVQRDTTLRLNVRTLGGGGGLSKRKGANPEAAAASQVTAAQQVEAATCDAAPTDAQPASMVVQAEALFAEADKNGDGKLSINELVALASCHGAETKEQWSEAVVRLTMERFDADKNGFLDLAEWRKALAALDEEAEYDNAVAVAKQAPLPEGSTWHENGGAELEPLLAFTTLVCVRWLLNFAKGEVLPELKGVVPAWQQLPKDEAEVKVEQLRLSTMEYGLPIGVLSYVRCAAVLNPSLLTPHVPLCTFKHCCSA